MNQDYPDYWIFKIGQRSEKNPDGSCCHLSSKKDHQLTLVIKSINFNSFLRDPAA